MFLNCFSLDLTVIHIDIMSIDHKDKIWVEIAKKFEMRTSGGGGGGGGGGSSVISDTPGRGGEGGGQKRANFCGRPLWMAPFSFVKFAIGPPPKFALTSRPAGLLMNEINICGES